MPNSPEACISIGVLTIPPFSAMAMSSSAFWSKVQHFSGASGLLSRIGLFELIHQLKIPNRASLLYPNRVHTFPESGKLRFPESVNEFPTSGVVPNFVPRLFNSDSGFTKIRIGSYCSSGSGFTNTESGFSTRSESGIS
ncbi:hypothetical protein OSB04_031448 [Centaurea solstitialis]|uniref:Uncharacterized protein n=1 Tax=Centaurea solstitialis TaxID=347529 RepID=A0AA38W4R6_9ASTR|nr:hypothetical protein OSB04_031448 [Centaurea solstitialis]